MKVTFWQDIVNTIGVRKVILTCPCCNTYVDIDETIVQTYIDTSLLCRKCNKLLKLYYEYSYKKDIGDIHYYQLIKSITNLIILDVCDNCFSMGYEDLIRINSKEIKINNTKIKNNEFIYLCHTCIQKFLNDDREQVIFLSTKDKISGLIPCCGCPDDRKEEDKDKCISCFEYKKEEGGKK